MFFRIYNNATGHALGIYEGETKAAALDTYARDAGYTSFADACAVTGDDSADDAGLTVDEVIIPDGYTDELATRWMTEAGEAGDLAMVLVCRSALERNPSAMAEVVRCERNARANDE